MPKKAIVPVLTALFEGLNKSANQAQPPSASLNTSVESFRPPMPEATETASPELGRVADALERIATALEKLTAENTDSPAETNQNDRDDWITLPVTNQYQAIPTFSTALPVVAAPEVQSVNPPIEVLVNPPINKSPVLNGAKLPVPAIAETQNSVLLKYLAERDIVIEEKAYIQEEAYRVRLEELALYLGQNFITCQELYELLKRNMVVPCNPFSYSLKGATSEQNRIIREFCRLLREAELLEEYTYQPKPDYNFHLKASGKEQKYLSGAWLESYVKLEVARIAQPYAARQQYEALPNLHILFKDTSKAELDLFFALGQKMFCVEAKTRPNLAVLQTYLNRIKPLELDNKAILIVVVNKSEEECLKLSQALGNVQVTDLSRLEQTIISLLEVTSKKKKT